MKALNVYYGTAHFAVTAGVLVWLFVRHPASYPRWRYSLACTTLLALIGFLAFPLMPPRLISPEFGMGSYVDSLNTIGGLWNFEDGAIAKLSNQYAAMPSLHFAWSLWVCLALWPRVRSSWGRGLAVAHPVITLVAIIATANHYWVDAAAGALTLLGGWLLGGVLCTRAVDRVARSRVRAGAAGAGGPGSDGAGLAAVVVGEPGCVQELAPGPEAADDDRRDGGRNGPAGAVAAGQAEARAERSDRSAPSARAG